MNSPRISVNKLGEFLVADSPLRRRAIVRDQKKENRAAVPRYRRATDPIESFLASGGMDVEPILSAAESLRAEPASSEWVESDNSSTAEALDAFLEVGDQLPFDGVTYVRGVKSPPKLQIEGVLVSVRPDFLLQFTRRGVLCLGALKFHFIKDEEKSLKQAGQEYVATLCHQWLLANAAAGHKALHTHCLSIDVFRKSIVAAPSAFTQRMKNIAVGCSDIALVWPTLP